MSFADWVIGLNPYDKFTWQVLGSQLRLPTEREYTVASIKLWDYLIQKKYITHKDEITRVIIPTNVTTIDISAFEDCKTLEQIDFPKEGNITIKAYAFAKCNALITIVLPKSVAEVQEYAFFECINLKTVDRVAKETTLKFNAFEGCAENPLQEKEILKEIKATTVNTRANHTVTIKEPDDKTTRKVSRAERTAYKLAQKSFHCMQDGEGFNVPFYSNDEPGMLVYGSSKYTKYTNLHEGSQELLLSYTGKYDRWGKEIPWVTGRLVKFFYDNTTDSMMLPDWEPHHIMCQTMFLDKDKQNEKVVGWFVSECEWVSVESEPDYKWLQSKEIYHRIHDPDVTVMTSKEIDATQIKLAKNKRNVGGAHVD